MMNNKYITRILALCIGVFMLGSCGDGLSDLNVDPNSPTDVPASNLFTEGVYKFFDVSHSRNLNGEWAMLMVQHWAQNEYTEEQRYDLDGNDIDFSFQEFYATSLNELSIAKEKVSNDEGLNDQLRANQVATIDIMMSAIFLTMTDMWGALPYSQALNGSEFPNPAYDSQQAIYNGVLSTLDNAVNSITVGAGGFSSGDPIHGGDMGLWKKTGASIMFRAAMRISDVDASTAQEYISKAEGNLISSNAENAIFDFSSEPALANPLFEDAELNNRDDFCVTDVLVDRLKAMNDPRLDLFASPNNSGEIVGMPYGLEDGAAFALKDGTSRPNDAVVRSAQSPSSLIDYAQVSFLRAEAIQRGLMSGDAASAYADGVTASMNQWGISDAAAIADYIATNAYDAGNWKESVGVQKWIHLYSNGIEAWSEQRRLDSPSLELPEAALTSVIPNRLPYPISEQVRNGASLEAVTSTPDDLESKLWWDVN